ncbi:MAG: hypothetical protein QOJ02_2109 [Acidobacteriota bacterium]|jgi:hypothetical protein|nr:hypothetical protein [Acidobacteriota bacterium]
MPKLIINSNPNPTNVNPGHYHIYLRQDNGVEVRQQLVGFSYFGEVGGLKTIPQNDGYVLLKAPDGTADGTTPFSCQSSSNVIRMTYEQWFDLLQSYKINFSRIFVFPDPEPSCYPFDHPNGPQYDLDAPGSLYLTLLQRYILYAQRRNIIVQISLAGVQTLRPRPWKFHPMNASPKDSGLPNNKNGYLNTIDGRTKFCVMQKPAGTVDTEPMKNYRTQSKMLDWILNVSSWAWNVVYELFNEPGGTIDDLVSQLDWLVTMAIWLDERLRDPVTGGHTHLITLNSGPELLAADSNNVLKRLLFDAQGKPRTHPLIDVFSFHGDQWGGKPGAAIRTAEQPNTPLTVDEIRQATIDAVKLFYSMALDAAGNVVQGSPVALICDSDGQYRAQDSPERYAGVVLKDLKLDYNHRWSDVWLTQLRLCGQLNGIKNSVPLK